MGERILGFTKDDVGLHSIRSGGAMAMFLSGVSTIVIMRVGRWMEQRGFPRGHQRASRTFCFRSIEENAQV